MKQYIIIIASLFLGSNLAYSQYFQANLKAEGTELKVSLVPQEKDLKATSLGQVEFFIRTDASSHVQIEEVLLHKEHFPMNSPIKFVREYTKDGYRIFHFGCPLTNNKVTRDYLLGKEYPLVSIPLKYAKEGEFFELMQDSNYETYLNLMSTKIQDLSRGLNTKKANLEPFVGANKQQEGTTLLQGTRLGKETLELEKISLKAALYPNPAANSLNVQLQAAKTTTSTVTLQNISGKTVLNRTIELNEGNNLLELNVAHLAPGNYFLVLDGNSKHKVCIQR